METVQEAQGPASIMEAVQDPRVPATDSGALNILLLGASGVGKSTFINALCNYVAHGSLDAAIKGELQCPIYSEFKQSYYDEEDNLQLKTIKVGVPDDGEDSIKVGESRTRKCKAYEFPYEESRVMIRLIDTPGILDTSGCNVDEDNMKHILTFLGQPEYEVLHAVCILLKPNEERLTSSLRYSIIRLLQKLHKDASSNILFCFTNSRSTQYGVGSTLPLLEEMLMPTRGEIKLNINLRKRSTMYYFDSEAFKFQAIMKNVKGFKPKAKDLIDYTNSWDQSAEEAKRLIQHVMTLEPHRLVDTLSLNHVRSILESIQKPLGHLAANMQDNLQQIKTTKEELKKGRGELNSYRSKLITVETYEETVALGHWQTVCTEKKCQETVCHEKCSPTETALGLLENAEEIIVDMVSRIPVSYAGFKISGMVDPQFKLIRKLTGARDDAVFCKVLSWSSEKCKVCGCPNSKHIRVNTKMERKTRETLDEEIKKVLENKSSEVEKKDSILNILEKKEEDMKAENKVVVEAAALFAGFLEQNSIITYHSAISEYYREEKKRLRNEGEGDRADELDKMLQLYNEKVSFFARRCLDNRDANITIKSVNEELEKLYKLELHGPQLKMWMDNLESEADYEEQLKAKAQAEAVSKGPKPSSSNAAGVDDGSRPHKGLRDAFRSRHTK